MIGINLRGLAYKRRMPDSRRVHTAAVVMARNEEKANSLLNRWQALRGEMASGTDGKRCAAAARRRAASVAHSTRPSPAGGVRSSRRSARACRRRRSGAGRSLRRWPSWCARFRTVRDSVNAAGPTAASSLSDPDPDHVSSRLPPQPPSASTLFEI